MGNYRRMGSFIFICFYQFHCGQKQVFQAMSEWFCIFKINKLDQHEEKQTSKQANKHSQPSRELFIKAAAVLREVCGQQQQTRLCEFPV